MKDEREKEKIRETKYNKIITITFEWWIYATGI